MSASDLAGLQAAALLLAAPVIGSFLGVVVRRLPEGRPVAWSRSRCETCGAGLTARDLVPLASWLVLRGRCRHCGHRLGWFYPAIEVAALAVAVISLACDEAPRAWIDSLFGWWLLALSWIDMRTWLLPDLLTLPLIGTGLLEAAVLDPPSLPGRAVGAIVGYAALRLVALAYRKLRETDGLGAGDAKLFGAIGAWLGVMALPDILLAAALIALLTVATLAASGQKIGAKSAVMFGPFLAAPAWILWLIDTPPR